MTEDEQLKKYDHVIMKRLWSYARRYKLHVFLALLALAIGTATELLLPLVIQRSIDNDILPQYWRIDRYAEPPATQRLSPDEGRIIAIGAVWLNTNALSKMHPGDLFRLRSQGYLATEPSIRLLDAKGNVFFLQKSAFDRIPEAQRKQLRTWDIDSLTRQACIYLALLFGSVVFAFVQMNSTALVGQLVMGDLRRDLLNKTLHQRQGFLQVNPVGKLVTRLTSDVETINELFSSVLSAFIKDLAIMVGVLVILFVMDARLALVVLFSLIPVGIIIWIFRNQARSAYRKVRAAVSGMNTFLSEHFSGMAIVQLFVRQKIVRNAFTKQNDVLLNSSLGEMKVFSIFRPITELLASVSLGLIIWAGAGQYLHGLISLGVLVAFLNLIGKFFEPVTDISDKFNILQSAMAGGERVFALLDEEHQIADNGTVTQPIRGDIEFRDVHFSYKPDEPVLRGMSFHVREGEKLAIVGTTGAGKTTISNVLTRLWDVQSGQILVDGTDQKAWKLDSLRSQIQPIQQDVFLFNDTLRENILLGKSLDDARLFEILEQVQAKDFVSALPEGLDTKIAEGSGNLSGGQRQLISFARILAQDPRVIIMDEATASIDTETERRVQNAMKALMQNRTSLVIAHRLSTIQDADRIVVLAHGGVVEQGNHQELMDAQGLYARLYQLQFSKN